jgi:hypothetical protein
MERVDSSWRRRTVTSAATSTGEGMGVTYGREGPVGIMTGRLLLLVMMAMSAAE